MDVSQLKIAARRIYKGRHALSPVHIVGAMRMNGGIRAAGQGNPAASAAKETAK
ncbi:hypothetical protein NVS89_18375 [Ancylobacter sp. MQZ15Z-1]|uniref:Uncharacterized protein n=1 Tax=Ancylobacter mangrovi TaxID=2972472 RepID=A0A9X2PH92_9HYPH|nr:hypothetical protein [Ancylobacter mangrovi]MCS0497056.1 hypothetical protein [Ancylobacter mangrovi]